jgi:hypothetical protein
MLTMFSPTHQLLPYEKQRETVDVEVDNKLATYGVRITSK